MSVNSLAQPSTKSEIPPPERVPWQTRAALAWSEKQERDANQKRADEQAKADAHRAVYCRHARELMSSVATILELPLSGLPPVVPHVNNVDVPTLRLGSTLFTLGSDFDTLRIVRQCDDCGAWLSSVQLVTLADVGRVRARFEPGEEHAHAPRPRSAWRRWLRGARWWGQR